MVVGQQRLPGLRVGRRFRNRLCRSVLARCRRTARLLNGEPLVRRHVPQLQEPVVRLRQDQDVDLVARMDERDRLLDGREHLPPHVVDRLGADLVADRPRARLLDGGAVVSSSPSHMLLRPTTLQVVRGSTQVPLMPLNLSFTAA